MNTEILLKGDEITLVLMDNGLWHDYYKNYVPDPMMDTTPYTYDRERLENVYHIKMRDETRLYFSIMLGEKTIGMIYLKHIDMKMKKSEFGIALSDDSVKGKGHGTEAIRLLIHYAFDVLGLDVLLADSVLRNTRSQHVLQKLGFRYTHEDSVFKFYRLDKTCGVCGQLECTELDR